MEDVLVTMGRPRPEGCDSDHVGGSGCGRHRGDHGGGVGGLGLKDMAVTAGGDCGLQDVVVTV